MVTEKQIKLARDKFKEISGITIYTPDEGSLDDFEQSRYDGLVAAIEAALSAADSNDGNPLLEWAVEQWRKQVQHRPIRNVHRRSLDDVWRQVIRWTGADPDALIGPPHDALLAAAPALPAAEPKPDFWDVEEAREKKLATVVAPDNGTTAEVLSAVLECAEAWVPEARIIGDVRAGDIARVVRSALSAQVQDVAGWQLIETAPKDWTNIILFDEERDPDVFEGYFSMEDGGRNCWMENQGAGAEPVNPTHWMPLPAAPAKQEV